MDVRRIYVVLRSLERQRPWQHKRTKQALAILVFVIPNLLLSVTLVPASQASRVTVQTQKSVGFKKYEVVKVVAPTPVAPVTAPTAPTVPTVLASPAPTPVAPAPTPVAAPVVDTSSAAAWAASPGVACIREHESGDNYSTDTGNGYYGAYQDLLSTWESHGGTGLPSDAPPAEQDQINYEIWLTGGWGQWSTAGACGL